MRAAVALAASCVLSLINPTIHPAGRLAPSVATAQPNPEEPNAPQPAETPFVEPERVPPLTGPQAVIPPGREDMLAEMLGRGATLPGNCTFTGGQIDRTSVKASYTCPGGAVVFELRHPSLTQSGAVETEKFAVILQSGSPPSGFAEELGARIRSREGPFEWKWLGVSPTRFSRLGVIIAAAVIGAGALWLLLRRRRRPATGA